MQRPIETFSALYFLISSPPTRPAGVLLSKATIAFAAIPGKRFRGPMLSEYKGDSVRNIGNVFQASADSPSAVANLASIIEKSPLPISQ
jgi:hypothetical protein